MRLQTTLAHSPHAPDPEQNTVLQLGLQQLDPNTWMQVDNDYPQFYQHKVETFARRPDNVYFAEPSSTTAQAEFHQQLVAHLQRDYPQHCNKISNQLPFTSLWHSSLLVQEDICLLEQIDERYCLTAASVCSPSNWRLEDKRGGNLDLIHKPVPGYQEQLSTRVQRLFSKLKSDAPLLRYNWSLQADNELWWRDDLNPNSIQNRKECMDFSQWYWRVERQTLMRLPTTEAIVFTIRIYLHQVANLPRTSQQHLWRIINALPPEQRAYKGLTFAPLLHK